MPVSEIEKRKGNRRVSEDRRRFQTGACEDWDGVERRSKDDRRREKERRAEDPGAIARKNLQHERWEKERARQEKRQQRRTEKEVFRP